MARRRKYHDEDWLRGRLRNHCSRREIAAECDVREETVAEWIDRFGVRLYRDEDWLRERVSRYWTPAQIAADCAVTVRTIERWMDRFGVQRPEPPTVADMEQHLETRFGDTDGVDKKDQIAALLGKYGDLAPKTRVTEVVGCTADYASRFHWSEGQRRVVQRHRREHESDSVPEHLRERVRERDDYRCVGCGSGQAAETELHHVIPGESTPDNLATLCRECHLDAHGGAFGNGVVYESREEFWEEWAERG